MEAAPTLAYTTVEEYLRMEEASDTKHELIDGMVYAMAGADFPHNQITSNLHGEVYQHLKGQPCRIYGSDLGVHVKTKSGFAYPDLSIICGKPEFYAGKKGVITNPVVIIEVLSPDTEAHDRGRKFMLYRQIETLQEYILISSTDRLVERFKKSAEGRWTLMEDEDATDSFLIEAIGFRGTLSDIYGEIAFEEGI